MDQREVQFFLEAAMLAAGRPLNIDQLQALFDGRMTPEKAEIRQAIASLNEEYEERGIIISEVASGFRMQVKTTMASRLQKLWEERPPRYSRALFETLALIAYRQPITRGEIEEIRGVAVSSNIVRLLLERDWVRVVGHRDVPGRPSMFGTTKLFLDYFGLKRLDDLPPLADLSDWESLRVQLNLPEVEGQSEVEIPELEAVNDAEHTGDADRSTDETSDAAGETGLEDADLPSIEMSSEVNTDLPVLHPEGEPEPNDVENAEGSSDGEDELVVSKWPEPVG